MDLKCNQTFHKRTISHIHTRRERRRERRRQCKDRAERDLKVDLEDWIDVDPNQATLQPPEARRGEEQILP